MRLRRVPTAALGRNELRSLRSLLDAAWPDGGFDHVDWEHATGGVHVVVELDGAIVSHAAVVERALWLGEVPVTAGYVEAVATHPASQGRGYGSTVILEINDVIRRTWKIGALSTGAHHFYERLGWLRWRGPTYVRTAGGLVRTEADDDGVMVLPTPAFPEPDLDAPIAVEWRPGDAW